MSHTNSEELETRREITKGLQLKDLADEDDIPDGVDSSDDEYIEGADSRRGDENPGNEEDTDSLGRISLNQTGTNAKIKKTTGILSLTKSEELTE